MDKLLMRKLREEKSLLLNRITEFDMSNIQDKKVMVIDDCKDTLNIVKKYIYKTNNVLVETFLDEYEAMQRFMKVKPDLIILDMNLSKLDGIKVSIIMKNLSSFNIPIIFISRDKKAKNEVTDYYGKNTIFVAKPIQKDKLLESVQAVLGH